MPVARVAVARIPHLVVTGATALLMFNKATLTFWMDACKVLFLQNSLLFSLRPVVLTFFCMCLSTVEQIITPGQKNTVAVRVEAWLFPSHLGSKKGVLQTKDFIFVVHLVISQFLSQKKHNIM